MDLVCIALLLDEVEENYQHVVAYGSVSVR